MGSRSDAEGAAGIAGRREELATLRGIVERAGRGKPGAVLVHGEAGIGKTRLVAEACRRSEQSRDPVVVLWGTCVQFGAASSPYRPIVSALESLGRSSVPPLSAEDAPGLVSLLSLLRGGGGPEPGRLLGAIDAALGGLAARRTTILVVDDLQWADATSLDVLGYLIAGFRDQRLALLMTYRDEGLADGHPLLGWLGDMLRLPSVTEMRVPRLAFHEVEEQVSLILGAPARHGLVNEVMERSGGNTYLTELLVRRLSPDATSLPPGLPDALRSALLATWHRLGADARTVVRLLSVAGRPFGYDEFAEVAATCGIPAETFDACIIEATQAGVLQRDSSHALWLRHPLLAEVLYETLLPGEARRLHRSFIETFDGDQELAPQRLGDLALHHEGAGMFDGAFEYSLRAAEAAAEVQAYTEESTLRFRAARHYRSVTPELRQRYPSEAALLADAVYSARRAGDFEGAWSAAVRAREVVDDVAEPLVAARVLRLWDSVGLGGGHLQNHCLEVLRKAVTLSQADPRSEEAVAALADLAEAEGWAGQLPEARAHAEQAVGSARLLGRPEIMSHAIGVRSFVNVGSPSAGPDAHECYELAVASGRPETVGLASITVANVLEEEGRIADCSRVFTEGQRAAADQGVRGLGALLAVYAAVFMLTEGRFVAARMMLREALAARSSGIVAIQARQVGMLLALRQGRVDEAEGHFLRLQELAPAFERHVGLNGPPMLAEYLLAHGRHEAAIRMLAENLPGATLADPKVGDLMMMWGARAAAEWAAAGRDARDSLGPEAAAKSLAQLEAARLTIDRPAFASLDSNPLQRATHARFLAEKSRCLGRESAAVWATAATAAADAGAGWLQAEASAGWARHLLVAGSASGSGRALEAAKPLRTAHMLAVEMEAEPLRREVEALARLSRISLAEPSTPTPAPASHEFRGLTRRELEILGHLVAGRSYREIAEELFISEKTVSVHVSNVLRKTGTRSRIEAAALARSRGFLAPGE